MRHDFIADPFGGGHYPVDHTQDGFGAAAIYFLIMLAIAVVVFGFSSMLTLLSDILAALGDLCVLVLQGIFDFGPVAWITIPVAFGAGFLVRGRRNRCR